MATAAAEPSGRFWLLLSGLFAGLVVVAGVWVALDRRPPVWDHANHLERAVHCERILKEPGRSRVKEILEMSSFYPPVVICAAGALYLLTGVHPLASQAVILAFLGIGLGALFVLGQWLFDAKTGILAALIFGTAPFVVYSTTNFQLDLPLAAVVILSLLVLVSTEEFSRRSWSIVMGLTLALGMLVKPPFAVYLFPPLILFAWRALRAPAPGQRLVNLGLTLLLGGALSLPWYGMRLSGLPIQIANRAFKQAAESGYPQTLTAFALLFYPRTLLLMFGLLAGPLFAWGLLALIRHPAARGLLWSASVVPFAVFLFIQNKNLRYVLPILPVAALIAAAGLRALAPAWRRGCTVALVALSALQVGAAAFGVPPVPPWTLFNVPLVFSFPPSPVTWPHRQILDVIVRESGGAPATVSVVPNHGLFSVSNFRYYAVRDRLPLRMTRAWNQYPLGVDFAILKTGDQGPEFSIAKAKRIMDRLAAGDAAFERVFPVIFTTPLPDGSVAIVRQRRVAPVEGVSPAVLARRVQAAMTRFLEPYARELEGFRVDLAYAPDALRRGEIRQVRLTARSALVAEFARKGARLRVRELDLTFNGVLINPHRLLASGEIELLDVDRLRVDHLVLTEQDLNAFFSEHRRLRGLRLGLEGGTVKLALSLPGPNVTARLKLLAGRAGTSAGAAGAPLTIQTERLSVAGIPLPAFLARWVLGAYDPAPRLATLSVAVELGALRVERGRIVISSTHPRLRRGYPSSRALRDTEFSAKL